MAFDPFSAALIPSLFVALWAGVISFLSPCVLPIVPPYLAYMSGLSMNELREAPRRNAAVVPALFFVLGLSTVFLLLGFTASAIGTFLLQNSTVLARVSGAVIAIMGLHFLGVIKIGFLSREARFSVERRGGAVFGAYVLGLAFAFGWTPCIGPVLGMILSMAAQEASVTRGTLLLGVYALGLGLPFLLAAVFLERSMSVMGALKRHMSLIERLMGLLLVIVGLAMLTGAFSKFSWWLLETFPGLALLG